MHLYTIGFTRKSAESFFEKLRMSGVERVVDVRLNNISQLAGFSKKDDLKYLLRAIAGIDYVHLPELAPTKIMLRNYQSHETDWPIYAAEFLKLIAERRIEQSLTEQGLQNNCLLCSEHEPYHCHRRLVAEYLQRHWNRTSVEHLV